MSNYDAWLEKPFQDACDAADKFEAAAERYVESDSYSEGIAQWYLDRITGGTDRSSVSIFELDWSLITPEMHEEYQASADFERAVESQMESDDDYPGPYEEDY
jgi:hypothetical protein